MSSPLKVGLLGLGFAARELKVPAYLASSEVRVHSVADPDPIVRAEVGDQLEVPELRRFSTIQGLLDSGGVDFVDISTPHTTHLPIVQAVSAAGIPMICDKPLAMTLAEADQMIGVTERSGVLAGLHHNFAFFPSHATLLQMVRDGTVGRVTYVGVDGIAIYAPGTESGQSGWRTEGASAGGGILIDYGIHAIYLALSALGHPTPRAVTALIDRRRIEGDVEDHASVLVDCGDSHASINLTWGSGTTGGVTVHGDNGSLRLLHPGGHSAPHQVASGVAYLTGRSDEQTRVLNWSRLPLSWYYGGSLVSFADAVRHRVTKPPVTFSDGRQVLDVVLAAYRSAATGTTVELPLTASDPVYQFGVMGLRQLALPATSVVLTRGLFEERDDH